MLVMMEVSLYAVSVSVLIILLTKTILRMTKSSSSSSTMKWPAGPKTLPIIGNLHQLRGDIFHVALAKLAGVHGGVMTIWVGSWSPVIVISNIDHVWEVLVSKSSDYSARHMPDLIKIVAGDNINTSDSGTFWYNLRKGLQNVPLGPVNICAQTNYQEGDIEQMICDMHEEATSNGGTVKPLYHLKRASTRLLCRLIFGHTFDDDSFIESINNAVEKMIRLGENVHLAEAFSYTKYLPSHKRLVRRSYELKLAIQQLVRPFLASSPPANTYLYFLLSQDHPEEVIISCIFELFLLGVDSTSSTTTWALAFLIHDQVVQEKLYQEIIQVSNGDRLLRSKDLSKMQYLQAVMKETMRMKPIAPFAIPHITSKDTTLMGTKVAKGTSVMVNLYALHHNQNIWVEPYKFMPQRFLQGQDDVNVKAMEQSFLPFSGGMRICAGMELGKLQFSLALANLVRTFKWTSVLDGNLPDMSEELSFITLMKTPLEARIICRNR